MHTHTYARTHAHEHSLVLVSVNHQCTPVPELMCGPIILCCAPLVFVWVRVGVYVCVCVFVHVCMYVCVRVCVYILMYTYVRVCVCADGRVFAWGSNTSGQLGVASREEFASTPVELKTLRGLPLSQVVCGGYHSFGVSVSGALYGWGKNR